MIHKFLNQLGWSILKILSGILGYMPLSLNLCVGHVIGSILFRTVKRKRGIALKSIGTAFPDMPDAKKKRIAQKNFILMAQSYLEMLYYLKHPEKLQDIDIEGKQHLDAALQKGKGIIGLTGHFGNFTLMHYKLAREGYPVAVVTRPMRNTKANDYFHNIRDRLNIKTIYTLPKKEAALNIIKSLKGNDLVIIQMDQDFRNQGVWVKFFNQMASTASGPVVFALRTGSVILPVYIIKKGPRKHVIKIEPSCDLEKKASKEETVLHNVQSLTNTIEQWVRTYPEQWGWINDRWKTRFQPKNDRGPK